MKPFQPVKGCDDFKMKHENESGDSSDNGESSDSSAMNKSREKLMADVRKCVLILVVQLRQRRVRNVKELQGCFYRLSWFFPLI